MTVAHDVLQELFGADNARAFATHAGPERIYATHRPLDALPAFLRTAELRSLDTLAARYRGPAAFGRGAHDTRTFQSDAHPLHLFKQGFTVYLHDVAALVPGASAWIASFERAFGVPAGCAKLGAFASPQGDGLPIHFDGEDVVSVQLSGTKVFEIAPVESLRFPVGPQFGPDMLPADDLYAQVANGFPKPDRTALQRVEMRPGSVLYLPRGSWHTTHAQSDSFSVSIGLRAPPALETLLAQLRQLLLQDPAWRRPLYGAAGSAQQREAALQDAEALLLSLPCAVASLRATHLVAPPSNEARPDPQRDERFQRVPMATLEITPLATTRRLRLAVSAWDREWIARPTLDTEIPVHLNAALEWIGKRDSAFTLGALVDDSTKVPPIDVWQLLDLLTRAGYLKRLPFAVLPVGTAGAE